jgi:hypothetical protein
MQERLEAGPEIIVQDLALFAPELVLGRAAILDVIRRVGEGHVSEPALQYPLLRRAASASATPGQAL